MSDPISENEQGSFPQNKLRLCYISNPNLIHTRRWVTWFARRGHTVCLLADVPLKENWLDVPVIDLSKFFYARYIRFPIWTLWLKRFLRQWHPDVLHAHRINSAGWMAAASGFHPYVITPWGTDIFVQPHQSWVAQLLARYALGNADLITTTSHAMWEDAVKLNARTDVLRYVHFGVEMDIFKPDLMIISEKKNLRRSLSIPENVRVILSPRAVTPIYNLDIILQSIPLVRARFPEAFFVFIDYNSDMDYKNQLNKISTDLKLEPYIHWIPQTGSRSDMAELYNLSDVIVSVASTDGSTPISILEAMACGKPVVCTDLPQTREYVTNNENGLLVPNREVTALAEAIILLLEQPHKAIEFGRKAHQVVVEKADSEQEMRRMESIYYELAALHRI
jgi:glycosyltransferase involved in cell wall biosynthesis